MENQFLFMQIPAWLSLFHGLGSAALVAFTHSIILRLEDMDRYGLTAQILNGLTFSAFAFLTMSTPMIFTPQIIIDGGTILVGLSGLFGGPVALLITTVAGIVHRLVFVGAVAPFSVLTILAVAICSYGFRRYYGPPLNLNIRIIAVFGVIVSAALLLTAFANPIAFDIGIFLKIAVPLIVAHILGITIVGWFLLRINELHNMAKQFSIGANTDPLTNLLNRRGLEREKLLMEQRATVQGKPFAILVMDLDRFKDLNDRFGHGSGDRALKEFAMLLHSLIPANASAARIGGEEFLVLLPYAGHEKLMELAENIRHETEKLRVHSDLGEFGFTVSIGAARSSQTARTFRTVFRLADESVLHAKTSGRNRVIMAATPGAETETAHSEVRARHAS